MVAWRLGRTEGDALMHSGYTLVVSPASATSGLDRLPPGLATRFRIVDCTGDVEAFAPAR
jgi:hypothetical protein